MSEQQVAKVKGRGDIMFLIDVTSSMEPCIDGLKEKLNTFLDELKDLAAKRSLPEQSFRLGLITFKDLTVPTDTNPLVFYDFGGENDLEEFRKLLQNIQIEPYQGGDEPESVMEALYVAAHKPSWREIGQVHKIVIVFTDNPPKEEFAINKLKELNYLEPGDENLPVSDFNSVLNVIGQIYCEKRIKTFIVAPENDKWKGFSKYFYNHMPIYLPASDINTGLKNADFEEIYKLLAKSITP